MADKPTYHRIGYIGLIEAVDPALTVAQPNQSTDNYELTTKSKNYDKQTGSYMRETAKESYTSSDYTNHNKVGYKNEYKTSSTVRVGDKRGYTEYYKQEKVTRVDYDSGSSYSGGGKGGGYKARYNPYKSYGGGKKYLN